MNIDQLRNSHSSNDIDKMMMKFVREDEALNFNVAGGEDKIDSGASCKFRYSHKISDL